MDGESWTDVGAAAVLSQRTVQEVLIDHTRIALTFADGQFGAISGICNHVGGPLGAGTLDGEYIVCPWHYWKFQRRTGRGELGFEEDRVPAYDVRVENGRVLIRNVATSKRARKPHSPHPLARPVRRESGPIRILGISTTAMTAGQPRYSTSDELLDHGLRKAVADGNCETRTIRLRDLAFRECEGFYSKSSSACTWPCSITQMDADDEMSQVYEGLVHWADAVVLATPIRWGGASSLYYKMVERMNCIQNQETVANNHLLRNKVAGFIITGGQDNVQAVAGQLLGFPTSLIRAAGPPRTWRTTSYTCSGPPNYTTAPRPSSSGAPRWPGNSSKQPLGLARSSRAAEKGHGSKGSDEPTSDAKQVVHPEQPPGGPRIQRFGKSAIRPQGGLLSGRRLA